MEGLASERRLAMHAAGKVWLPTLQYMQQVRCGCTHCSRRARLAAHTAATAQPTGLASMGLLSAQWCGELTLHPLCPHLLHPFSQ